MREKFQLTKLVLICTDIFVLMKLVLFDMH